MERNRFVEVAPAYYALAICIFFRTGERSAVRDTIEDHFVVVGEDGEPPHSLLENTLLFDKGIAWLAERDAIEFILDDFGPTIYSASGNFYALWQTFCQDAELPFYKFNVGGEKIGWLQQALGALNDSFDRLNISEADFEKPDSEWSPLPLERGNYQLEDAIKSLDQTIEMVRADNGYAATLQEERNYVLDGLTATLQTLKTATSTSVAYLKKYAFDPLGVLIRRYKGAAIGVAAVTTQGILAELLKSYGVDLLRWLFGK